MKGREKERRKLRFDVAVMCGLRPNCKAHVMLDELVKRGLLSEKEVERLIYGKQETKTARELAKKITARLP